MNSHSAIHISVPTITQLYKLLHLFPIQILSKPCKYFDHENLYDFILFTSILEQGSEIFLTSSPARVLLHMALISNSLGQHLCRT